MNDFLVGLTTTILANIVPRKVKHETRLESFLVLNIDRVLDLLFWLN